jgi:GMC oxidoreductase
MAKSFWLKASPTLHKLIGFPAVPQNYKPGPHYEYEFLQFPPGDTPEVIETDVIVVGSGCGGSVCAKNLAEAGHKVLVVEKSYYYPPAQVPMTEKAATVHLFENGGAMTSDDSSIYVTAGSTWGGGGAVNWSASLQPQWFVRKEWSEDRGLNFFGTDEFQACLDRVCDRMGVSTDYIRHNHANRVLLEGARRLGYHAKGNVLVSLRKSPIKLLTIGHQSCSTKYGRS